MVRYLVLLQMTEKGFREIKDSTQRAAAFAADVKAAGGKVVQQYWAVGQYDGAVIIEAPDEPTAASLLLKLAHQGFVRTQSQRLLNTEEFQAVLAK